MIDHATIEYHLDHLGAILTPRKWHGAHIIVAGGVRAAFNDIKADVARLQADNQRLQNNETEALDRMKRAENRANLADAKVREREETISQLKAILRYYADEGNWASRDSWAGDEPGWKQAQAALERNR